MRFKKLLYVFLLSSSMCFASVYESVDQKVRNYPYFKSVEHLGIRIMNDFDSDTDRVRAAFIWIVYNMDYGRSYDMIFQADRYFPYYSNFGRKYQMRQLEIERVEQSFRERLGVCLDYSLLLKELCTLFEIPSEIIIGVTKTEIRDLKGDQLLKNHTWNAIKINGEWKLVDPTWASNQMHKGLLRIYGSYIDQYFFTEPIDFIKSHLPANSAWQLLDEPIDANNFAMAPSYFPAYFANEVELSPQTSGIISLADYDEYLLIFDKLPAVGQMHYTLDESRTLKKMGIKKSENQPYVSVIKLKKKLKKSHGFLTVFMDYKPILKFKIEDRILAPANWESEPVTP